MKMHQKAQASEGFHLTTPCDLVTLTARGVYLRFTYSAYVMSSIVDAQALTNIFREPQTNTARESPFRSSQAPNR